MNNTNLTRTPLKRFSPWNYVVLLSVFISSVVYALPNLYGNDPSLVISSRKGDITADMRMQQGVLHLLDINLIGVKSHETRDDSWIIRFDNVDTQFRAFGLVTKEIPKTYAVSYTLASRSPEWLQSIGATPMQLGLDLQGGIHLLYEVDMEAAIAKAEERYIDEIKVALQEKNIRYRNIEPFKSDRNRGLVIDFDSVNDARDALKQLDKVIADFKYSIKELGDFVSIVATLTENIQADIKQRALEKNISSLRNRANELGVSEPIIQKQGTDRIVVELPGVQDPDRVIEVLGSTATLEFRLVQESR